MKNVFYSCSPFGTASIMTGSPNISINAGIATLSVPQTSNIGQGDRITYGGHIAYISKVNSPVSFDVIDNVGSAAGNHESVGVTSIAHEYASLSAAIAGILDANHINTSNLITGDFFVNIVCYYDHVDGTPDAGFNINGYVCDESHYMNIFTPTGGTQSILNNRHQGKWDASKFYASVVDASLMSYADDYSRVRGIQMLIKATADAYRKLINFGGGASITNARFSHGILKYDPESSAKAFGLYNGDTDDNIVNFLFYNNILIGFTHANAIAAYLPEGTAGSSFKVYNNTFVGNKLAISQHATNFHGSLSCKNNLFVDNDTDTANLDKTKCDYNSTDNGSLGYVASAHDKLNQSFSFVDADDYHLAEGDLGARSNGVDLSAEGITDDLDETARWEFDCGADEYPAPVIPPEEEETTTGFPPSMQIIRGLQSKRKPLRAGWERPKRERP